MEKDHDLWRERAHGIEDYDSRSLLRIPDRILVPSAITVMNTYRFQHAYSRMLARSNENLLAISDYYTVVDIVLLAGCQIS